MDDASTHLAAQSAELAVAVTPGNVTEFHQQIIQVADILRTAFDRGHVAYVAGNGGSAAEAFHLSDEMLGRYKNSPRAPLPVVNLAADGAVLTCISNDFGFEQVFSRQIEAVGKEGDVFIGLSTSGESKNILRAIDQAKTNGMTVITLTGPTGTMREQADYAIVAPTDKPPRMQELHLHAIHLLCELLEV